MHSKPSRQASDQPAFNQPSAAAPSATAPEGPLLEAIDLGRRVGDAWLVRHVSLVVNAGDLLVVRGANGAGKSVLLRLLCQLDPTDEGELRHRGRRVADADVPAFRRQVLYCAQRPAFLPGTVRENLQAACALRSATKSYAPAQAEAWLASAGGDEQPSALLEQSVEHLSGGEQLTAALLRAMLAEPDVLLLDEPTAALDENAAPRIERLLLQWLADSSERAIVWVTHDSQQAERLGGRALWIDAGRLLPAAKGA